MSKTILFMPKLTKHREFHYFPVSLLSVAAPMVATGEDISIFDERVDSWHKFFREFNTADTVMFSVYTGYQVTRFLMVAKAIRKVNPEIKIVVGGPHCTALPEQTLTSEYVDEIVCGDVDTGEYPLPYHLIDLSKYVNPETKRFAYVSSWGCVGRCSFCATQPPRPYKLLPMKRVKADFEYLMSHYPFEEVCFFDASLFSSQERVKQIIELMWHYDLRWISDARAPEVVKTPEAILNKCVESKVQQLTVGLESGSPRIVKMMRKGEFHLQHYKQAAEKLAKYPIKLVSGVIFGTPTETVEDLKMTLDFILKIRAINPNFFVSSTFYKPLPNTVMCDLAKEHGYVEPDSLAAWAELGQQSHYEYNEYQEAPWIPEPDRHRALYEDFKSKNEELFV